MSPSAQFDPDTFMASRSRPATGATFDPDTFMAGRGASAASQHVPAHPLAGHNFGDWLSEELLDPIVSSMTALGRGMAGFADPTKAPTMEHVKDIVNGAFGVALPFMMGGLGGKKSAAPGPSPPAEPPVAASTPAGGISLPEIPPVVATAIRVVHPLKGGLAIRGYNLIRNMLEPAASGATEPVAAPAADQELLDGLAQGFGAKKFSSLTPKDQAEVQGLADRIKGAEGSVASAGQENAPQAPQQYVQRPPEYYGVKPAEIPPTTAAPMNQAARRATVMPPETGQIARPRPVQPPFDYSKVTGVNVPVRPPVASPPAPPTYPYFNPATLPELPSISLVRPPYDYSELGGVNAPVRPPLRPTSPAERPAVNQPESAQPAEAPAPSPAPPGRFQEVGKTSEAYPEILGPGLSVFRVPIEDAVPSENPYALGKGPQVQEYAERLKSGEEPPPLYGRVNEEGKVSIADGNTRLEAQRQAGAQTVDVATSNPAPFREQVPNEFYQGAAREVRADRAASLGRVLHEAGIPASDLGGMELSNWQQVAAAHGIDLPKSGPAQAKLFQQAIIEVKRLEAEKAATNFNPRATIKPPPGFSLGEHKNYFAR
jgi:hypothetical protein